MLKDKNNSKDVLRSTSFNDKTLDKNENLSKFTDDEIYLKKNMGNTIK